MTAQRADVAWVLLTMGDRPAELGAAVEGLLAHDPAPARVVVVANGCDPQALGLDSRVELVAVPENVGIPAGRNLGAARCTESVVAFLDDDAATPGADLTGRLDGAFQADPGLAVVTMRILDPVDGSTRQRHVPTVGGRGVHLAREVTTFLGGACAVRRTAWEAVGGYEGRFFYAHEETDLAWRLLDRGWSIRYEPDCIVTHPATTPGRHAMAARLTARNRVWLARRNLPLPLGVVYVSVWLVLTALRRSFPRAPFIEGLREGWREPCGPRRPMSWSTVWRMTRLGRPPVV